MNAILKHLKAAGAWALYALEATDQQEEARCIRNADFHLWEANRLRRNAELDAELESNLKIELNTVNAT